MRYLTWMFAALSAALGLAWWYERNRARGEIEGFKDGWRAEHDRLNPPGV